MRKIFFVVGHFYSSITLAVSEIYANHSILEITPSATNPQITERGLDLIFRTCGRDDQQSAVAANISPRRRAKKSQSCSTIQPMAKDSGTMSGSGLPKPCSGMCFTRASTKAARITDGLSDASRRRQPIWFIGAAAMRTPVFSSRNARRGRNGAAFRQRFPGIGRIRASRGRLSRRRADDLPRRSAPPPASSGRDERIPRARHRSPRFLRLNAYAAVEVLAQAAKAAGTFDPGRDRQGRSIPAGPFPTVLGTLTYDTKGDVTTPIMLSMRGGRGYEDPARIWRTDDPNNHAILARPGKA